MGGAPTVIAAGAAHALPASRAPVPRSGRGPETWRRARPGPAEHVRLSEMYFVPPGLQDSPALRTLRGMVSEMVLCSTVMKDLD